LLVGNFGDGEINLFNPSTGVFLGTLLDPSGTPLGIDGLWGLQFGNGGSGGAANTLYFSAGPGDESHGLFGSVDPVPEPATWLLVAGAFGLLGVLRRRRAA
jgi:uncharacterized protein (TIGR03118 family)